MTKRTAARKPKLRKQPRRRRRLHAASAASMPQLRLPKAARRRRRRNQRRVRLPFASLWRIIFSARWVSLALLSMTVYALVLTGLDAQFYITTIPVAGASSIPSQEIAAASGLGSRHIFAADPNQAAARIAELPGVLAATVTLSWPNEVMISVREDAPIAIWQEGANQFWITENGRLIPARTASLGLLVIESQMVPEQVEPVVAAAEEAAMLPEPAIAFVPADLLEGALLLRQLRPNIEQLSYRPSSGLSYQDGRGWQVYFGTGTDMQQKLVVYETVVADLEARGITPAYISVSNQEKPYYGLGSE